VRDNIGINQSLYRRALFKDNVREKVDQLKNTAENLRHGLSLKNKTH